MEAHKDTAGGGLWSGDLILFDSLPSTNQWVLDNLADCSHGDVISATTQTRGRGRFCRKWHCAPCRGITLSVVLFPAPPETAVPPSVSQAAALAVSAAVERYSVTTAVKWPNDVMAGGRKIAGILGEAEPESGAVALGIGLNVNMTADDFDGLELLQPATSMSIETGCEYSIPDVRAALLAELEAKLDPGRSPPAQLRSDWEQRDFLAEKNIVVQTPTGPVQGVYKGMDGTGRLILADTHGVRRTFLSGDVSVSAS